MDWLIERYNNGKCEYIINKTGEKKGTVVIPTGGGKSGVIYEDMIWHILHAEEGKKYIFNLCSPILKLAKQTADDGIAVIKTIFKDKCDKGEFMFMLNSSADGDSYNIDGLNADVNRLGDMPKFKDSKNAKFAIMVSCYPSLVKCAEKMDYLNSFATVITYMDEAHLAINETRDDRDYDSLTDEGKERWSSLEKICEGEMVYALTATPDKYISMIINKAAGKDVDAENIIEIPARELIAKNIILPVNTFMRRASIEYQDKITADICMDFMRIVKQDNPNIAHKVLVTCATTKHLKALRDELSKQAKVFSTNAAEGGKYAEEEETIDIDELEFIKEVDTYEGDCFVLHIRQLRQGIDIKSLTDTIFYNSTQVNDGVKRTIVQTIGRILRPMEGERGKHVDERKKKRGNVLFLIKDDEYYDSIVKGTEHFLLKYYGRDGVSCFTLETEKDYGEIGKDKSGKFVFGDGKFWDDYSDLFEAEIEELKIRMGEYIKKNIKPKYDTFLRITKGKNVANLLPAAMAEMKKKFYLFNEETNTAELLSDTEFMKAVSDLFNHWGVE